MSKLIRSFGYALKGLRYVYSVTPNMYIHTAFVMGAVALAIILHISAVEWSLILLCIALVLSAEIVNTAIEHIVNWISPEYHESAGRIKDMAAAAVMVCAAIAAVIGLIIFIPKIFA